MTPTAVPPPPPITSPGAPANASSDPGFWRRRGVRAAWVVLGSLFTLVALVWGTLEAVGTIAHDVTTETATWDASDGIDTLVVLNSAGDVDVRAGASGDGTIEMTSRISRGLFETDHSERVEGNRLVLRTNCPEIINQHCSVDMDLVVPADIDVEVVSHKGGTSIADVDGTVSLWSEDGPVELLRLGGALDLTVRHGSTTATGLTADDVVASSEHGRMQLGFAEAPSSLVIRSEFADVDVTVPDDGTAFAVTSSSDFGHVDNHLRVDPQSPLRIEVTVEFGRATLSYAG